MDLGFIREMMVVMGMSTIRSVVEALEGRRLMSGVVSVADPGTSPVSAIEVSVPALKSFQGQVGSWTVEGGLPSKSSGTVAIGLIEWGDGKTSKAKLVDDGSGVVQIVGQHVWSHQGVFQVTVKIEEYPKAHPKQLTDIGQGTASATVNPKQHLVKIGGTFTGSYTNPLGNPDIPRRYHFTSSGTAGAMGSVDLTGSIAPPGFIRGSSSTGQITLTNANGSITIDVTGKLQTGGGPLPRKLTYTISDSTGNYVSAIGKGSVSLVLDTTANTFVMVIR
jgi:hypothetical protein